MLHFEQILTALLSQMAAPKIWLGALALCAYAGLLRGTTLIANERVKNGLFALINIAAVGFIFKSKNLELQILVGYLLAVGFCFVLMRYLADKKGWLIATLVPILMLAFIRYAPIPRSLELGLVGISYMAFRLSQLVIIVRNGIVPKPSIAEYFSFAFFGPTFIVGPISSYSTFKASFHVPKQVDMPIGLCLMRMLVGGSKLLFFANIFNRLTYKGLLLDGHAHPPVDLLVAAVAYYLFLYCNFSGFCDAMIGLSGLAGIKVSENFNFPFAARNMKEFWNRWHITLSSYMRDMFFAPVSKALVRRFPKAANHAIALSITMVFILIGIWHGKELNYLIWGFLNAAAVVANHYYGIFLKDHLTKEQLQRYNQNQLIHAISVAATFIFVCISLFFFANSISDMEQISKALQW